MRNKITQFAAGAFVSSQYLRVNVPPGPEQRRSGLLEQLLARADSRASMSDWRTEAFSVIAPTTTAMPPIAATALCADRGAVAAAWVCLATPVHYIAEMTSVRLAGDGILTLSPQHADALAVDFNRVWQGAGIALTVARSGQLLCLFDRPVVASSRDPHEALGQLIEEYLPAGAGSAPLRQLISETEMWLFEHGVNDARGKAAQAVVNGLWFWGGGAPLAALPAVRGWVGGDDVFFNAFGARTDAGLGSGVVAVNGAPGSASWQEIESRWLRPAIAQLHSGELSRLEISIENWRFTLNSRTLRRFWRRRKPWWEFLA
jgi:hypothetical protein